MTLCRYRVNVWVTCSCVDNYEELQGGRTEGGRLGREGGWGERGRLGREGGRGETEGMKRGVHKGVL